MESGALNHMKIELKEKVKKFNLLSYLSLSDNKLNYRQRYGGDYKMNLCGIANQNADEKKLEIKQRAFLQKLEKVKDDWQVSLKLLKETTDIDLIDYAIYLAKANEAHYRYLLKIAKKENIVCPISRGNFFHDI